MLATVIYECKQFVRRPIWIVLFIFSIVICIVLPRGNFTNFYDLPSMVYFVMTINLLFLLFGAEEARFEYKNNLSEQLRNLPYQNKYRIGKITFWGLLSFLYYLIFYASMLSYYVLFEHQELSLYNLQLTFTYTIFVWFIPFFFSILIGYIIFSLLPNISSYLLIILVWFLIMPYNSMLGFIPTFIGAWFINGDPNITQAISYYSLEIMQVNRGYFVQRSVMLFILISLYALLKLNLTIKSKYSLIVLLLFSLSIPFLSPFVPQISNEETGIDEKNYFTSTNILEKATNYTLTSYTFDINHHYNKHSLSYTVKIDLSANNSDIQLALWDEFKVKDLKFNNNHIDYLQKDNIVTLSIPELEGEIALFIETDNYDAIAPTSYELLATTPWYPMNPKEALDPYTRGEKESYYINLSNSSGVSTNLEDVGNNQLEGEAYGPTILKGDFNKLDSFLYPSSINVKEVRVNKERVFNEVDKINQRLATNLSLSCESIIVTTLYPTFSANPNECYFFMNEDINQSSNIFTNFYLDEGATSLFEAFYYNAIQHESWQNFLKQEYNEEAITKITSYYKKLSDEQRAQLIQQWYKEIQGSVTPEQMIQDMEDIYAGS